MSMLPRRAALWTAPALIVSWLLSTVGAAPSPPLLPEQMPTAERVRLMQVAETASVSTQVDGEPFPCRSDIFEYLVDPPEFATHVTQMLKLARYRIWRTPRASISTTAGGPPGTSPSCTWRR